MNENYSLTNNIWGYVIFDPIENFDSNKAIKFLIEEFMYLKKNIVLKKDACDYWIYNASLKGIKCTKDDVQNTYDIVYGHGCEFEWEAP